MRILVVGAGAIGGYFGGRLEAAGRDVTFLVRTRRAAQLAKTGLVIRSPLGDVERALAADVTADENLRTPFDLILLSCKAYDLDFGDRLLCAGRRTEYRDPATAQRHGPYRSRSLRVSAQRAVLGGQCLISTTLDAEGRILHLSRFALSLVRRAGRYEVPARCKRSLRHCPALASTLSLSTAIMQEMWEKWAFIATGAGITCLMRAAFGDIVAAGAVNLTTGLY